MSFKALDRAAQRLDLLGWPDAHISRICSAPLRRLAKIFRFRFDPDPDVCPTTSFVVDELEWPRIVRRVFSDPVVEHVSTGIKGRGTEEVKDLGKIRVARTVGDFVPHLRSDSQKLPHFATTNDKCLAAVGAGFLSLFH